MEALVDLLLDWIGDNTGYRTEGIARPAVVAMTPRQLTREYYTGALQLLPNDGIDERVLALYAPGDGPAGTVYVLAPAYAADAEHFDDPLDNPLFRETVLHELIHHAQWQSGITASWGCQKQGETEAYLLGGRYLRQVGATDPIPNRNFWARTYSQC